MSFSIPPRNISKGYFPWPTAPCATGVTRNVFRCFDPTDRWFYFLRDAQPKDDNSIARKTRKYVNSLESFKGRGGGGGRGTAGGIHTPHGVKLFRTGDTFPLAEGGIHTPHGVKRCRTGDTFPMTPLGEEALTSETQSKGVSMIPFPSILGWLHVRISGGCILYIFAVL